MKCYYKINDGLAVLYDYVLKTYTLVEPKSYHIKPYDILQRKSYDQVLLKSRYITSKKLTLTFVLPYCEYNCWYCLGYDIKTSKRFKLNETQLEKLIQHVHDNMDLRKVDVVFAGGEPCSTIVENQIFIEKVSKWFEIDKVTYVTTLLPLLKESQDVYVKHFEQFENLEFIVTFGAKNKAHCSITHKELLDDKLRLLQDLHKLGKVTIHQFLMGEFINLFYYVQERLDFEFHYEVLGLRLVSNKLKNQFKSILNETRRMFRIISKFGLEVNTNIKPFDPTKINRNTNIIISSLPNQTELRTSWDNNSYNSPNRPSCTKCSFLPFCKLNLYPRMINDLNCSNHLRSLLVQHYLYLKSTKCLS